ncbi:hypothetical protein IE53DRAFT_99422 [Violaceomyces palustris]|uniref:Uncharacterized protein n=1 Tax=Violaceomyces palustris TaxID=1673888 RepID=A0ACD0NX09_9BASI|nr:hypothetical protein IE53DRAFT_99422 [Violaceomyces palustris]
MPRRRLDEPDESANFDLDYGDGLDYSKPPSSSNPFPRDDSTTTKSPPRNLTTPPPPDLLEAPKSQLIHPRALPAAYQDHDERPPTEQESDGREEGEVSSPESQHAPLPVPSASASRRSPFLGETSLIRCCK